MQLDVFVKRKRLEESKHGLNMEGKIPDKRKFKVEMTPEESLEKSIISEIETFGAPDPGRMLTVIKKIPHWQTLNITLLLIVYFYFLERNFDFGIVIKNFDQDFDNVVKDIYERGRFPKLDGGKFTPLEKYKFRQDFIIYMILIDNIDLEGLDLPIGGGDQTSETNTFYDEAVPGFDVIGD